MNQVKERAAGEVADESCVDVGSARGRLRCGVTLGERWAIPGDIDHDDDTERDEHVEASGVEDVPESHDDR